MVALDANILIYFLEKNPHHFEAAKQILFPVLDGHSNVCASVLVITEILSNNSDERILGLFEHPNIRLQPIDANAARLAGELRRNHKLKTPDALHLATAISAGADTFITNDLALCKIKISGLKVRPLHTSE